MKKPRDNPLILKKSEIFYSEKVSINVMDGVANILRVQQVLGTCKHLDLLFMVGRSRKTTFNLLNIES